MAYQGNSPAANFQSLPAVQRFNGTGSATAFTLASVVPNDQSILVSVDGVTQDSNAYSVSGTTLTFTAAPSAGTGNIFVNTISPVGSTVVPPDGSVTKVKTDFYISQATAPSSPSEGDMWFNTSASTVSTIESKSLGVYSGTRWRAATTLGITASGGTERTYSGYKSHTFTSSGTFTPNTSGLVEIMVVAGGGAGGNWHAGGGGAGGMQISNVNVTPQEYSIVVGAGGAGGTSSVGSNGANSSGLGVTSLGGGRGGSYSATAPASGGSGAGGNGNSAAMYLGAAGTAGQGNAGGNGPYAHAGGGGGGKGTVGINAANSTTGGAGGGGLANNYSTGLDVTYAGGGGGGVWANGTLGVGGSGGGGNGSNNGNAGTAPTPGTANTGGGGGGFGGQGNNASMAAQTTGGSGIVVIRYVN